MKAILRGSGELCIPSRSGGYLLGHVSLRDMVGSSDTTNANTACEAFQLEGWEPGYAHSGSFKEPTLAETWMNWYRHPREKWLRAKKKKKVFAKN